MNACKRFGLSTPLTLLAALTSAACIAVPADDPGDANRRVDNVVVVGTSVTSALYTTGDLGLTTVPKAGANDVVLSKDLKVSLAFLKLPAGALTAIGGLILIHGEFIPGLTDLDSQGQILAYAIILGVAQQLVTRFVDQKAEDVLAAVPSKGRRPMDAQGANAESQATGQEPRPVTSTP